MHILKRLQHPCEMRQPRQDDHDVQDLMAAADNVECVREEAFRDLERSMICVSFSEVRWRWDLAWAG